MTKRIACVLLMAACGGGSDEPKHWKDQPLEAQTGSVQGHAYTIQLPRGMEKRASDTSDEYQYHQKKNGEGYTFAPWLVVQWKDKPETLDEAMKYEKATPTKKETTADGFVVVYPNDTGKPDDIMITIEKNAGSGAFYCHARVYPMKRGESVKDLVPKVEAMCNSIAAK